MSDVKLPPLPEPILHSGTKLVPYEVRFFGTPGLAPQLGYAADIRNYYNADQMTEYARLAVLQERERCAKICKDIRYNKAGIFYEGYDEGCDDCADAIRKGA